MSLNVWTKWVVVEVAAIVVPGSDLGAAGRWAEIEVLEARVVASRMIQIRRGTGAHPLSADLGARRSDADPEVQPAEEQML